MRRLVYTSLLLIIMLCFSCGENKICSTFKKSQNINMIVCKILFGCNLLYLSNKNVLDQTWKAFNTKFGSQWKDWESNYQVRQILALFLKIKCYNFWTKIVKKNQIWRGLGQVRSKKLFPETPLTNYLRETLVFMWNSSLHEKFNFCFSKYFS